ncbi:DUF2341 domain-containing protein [Aureimonas sp. D3]|uniref:DUF2341 domain-containing protein n=1 Tax=Aureimonas sp. D3 TaxID=1638164 RepID=UPI0007802751|nr:DUF2341 domain-containing protein [Aureimonas sp. D3]
MAFKLNALSRVATSDRGNRERTSFYVYSTGDSAAEIAADGYFNGALQYADLNVGDVIDCVCAVRDTPSSMKMIVSSVVKASNAATGIVQVRQNSAAGGSVPVSTNWTQERAVTIANTAGAAATGYQSLVLLDANNFDFVGVDAAGNGLRFLDSDRATALPYWIETFDASAKTARVWVKANLPAGQTKTIYLYSGKTDAAAKSRIDTTMEFGDDFKGTPGWMREVVVNPIVKAVPTTWRADIAGDPMVIKPSSSRPRWGAFYFGANGNGGGIGYMEADKDAASWDGRTWVDKSPDPILAAGGPDDMHFAIKPSVFEEGGKLHMAYAGRTNGANWKILYATADADKPLGPWTKVGVLLAPNGSEAEGSRIDCPCWFGDPKDGKVKLYYSGNEAVANEPRNMLLATADSFAGPFTRRSQPLVMHSAVKDLISWMAGGLGGMSIRIMADGTYEMAYNAFDADGISRMGRTTSTDGVTWALKASDLMFDRIAGAWDAVKLYRPCIYDIGDGVMRLLYNALGGTENIGYAEFGTVWDASKWTPNYQGQARQHIENGALRFEETQSSNPGNYFMMTSAYKPGDNIVVEARAKLLAFHDSGYAEVSPIHLSGNRPFPSNAPPAHFLFVSANSKDVRHQNAYAPSGGWPWGSEDVVLGSLPTMGAYHRYRATLRSDSKDWEVLSDAGVSLGKVSANTDNPLTNDLPLAFGLHGAGMDLDFVFARKHMAMPPTVSVGAVNAVSRADL